MPEDAWQPDAFFAAGASCPSAKGCGGTHLRPMVLWQMPFLRFATSGFALPDDLLRMARRGCGVVS